jgi:hypothetical protein
VQPLLYSRHLVTDGASPKLISAGREWSSSLISETIWCNRNSFAWEVSVENVSLLRDPREEIADVGWSPLSTTRRLDAVCVQGIRHRPKRCGALALQSGHSVR